MKDRLLFYYSQTTANKELNEMHANLWAKDHKTFRSLKNNSNSEVYDREFAIKESESIEILKLI